MNRQSVVTALAVLAVSFSYGCASGGGGGSSDQDFGAGSLQAQIWNRSDQTIVVYARWGNSPRVRLGQLSRGRRASYTTGIQGPRMSISWDMLTGSVPAGTAGAGAAFPNVADGPGNPQCPVDVAAGDRVEWTIGFSGRSCSYVRLDPGFE